MDIKWLKDKLNKKFYPISHAKSVIVDNQNKTLDTKLSEIDNNLSELDTALEEKAPSNNPIFTGSMSMGRKLGSTVGAYSTAEGYNPTASVAFSHAEGSETVASDIGSHAEGQKTTASGGYSHAEGCETEADGNYAHAEGQSTHATGDYSHAEGFTTYASGEHSHAEGMQTNASGVGSHASGYVTQALDYQSTVGHFNKTSSATASTSQGTGTGSAFVVGNGTPTGRSNAFRVNDNGQPFGQQAYTTQGCDYAEFYEWLDENTDAEDRRGYFVTLDGEKIKIASPGDFVLGIVSAWPSVIGNGDEEWLGRYVLDEFGSRIAETFEYEVEEKEIITNGDGKRENITKKVKKTGTRWRQNQEYDPNVHYIQRSERAEWDAIGMLGVLAVRDDGSCKVNGFCALAEGGIATASEKGYRVIKRVNDHIVKVIFR